MPIPHAVWLLFSLATALEMVAAHADEAERVAAAAPVQQAPVLDVGELQWARDGVVIASADELSVRHSGEQVETETLDLPDGRRLARFAWRPREEYKFTLAGRAAGLRAPQAPTPVLLHTVALEDVSQAAAAGSPPDAVVRFSPDGLQLAIGSFGGWLRIVDAHSGRLLHGRRITEGMVKQLAWSTDGSRLYVGEQSPDARLFAMSTQLDAAGKRTYAIEWSLRLADQLHTSRPPAEDRYGIYTLPAVYDLQVVADGRIFAAGVHSWSVNGEPRKRSVVYCVDAHGKTQWRFPAADAWSGTISHLAVDSRGTKVLFLPGPLAASEKESTRLADMLFQLDAATGQINAQIQLKPLGPHFAHVESWDSISLSADGAHAVLGLSDGRGLLLQTASQSLAVLNELHLGAPITVGNIPIAAACSYGRVVGELVCFQTQNSHIPFSNPLAAQRAPSIHPGANTLTVCDLEGRRRWAYRGPFALGGIWADGEPYGRTSRWLVVTCRALPEAAEPGAFGFLLFDLRGEGGGRDRLVYHYPTQGPVTFAADITHDGRLIAVVEVPAPTPDRESVYGTHQVHVVH